MMKTGYGVGQVKIHFIHFIRRYDQPIIGGGAMPLQGSNLTFDEHGYIQASYKETTLKDKKEKEGDMDNERLNELKERFFTFKWINDKNGKELMLIRDNLAKHFVLHQEWYDAYDKADETIKEWVMGDKV